MSDTPAATVPAAAQNARLAGLVVVCAATAFYGLSFWNRYLGVSVDGWFFHFGQALLRGVVPYRDYFYWSTPLHILEQAAVGLVFGPSIAAGHAVGAALRVVLVGVTYLWLTRRVRPGLAVLVCVAMMVVGYDDNSEPLFYYTQQAILYGVIAGYLASVAFDRSGRAAYGRWLASGFAVGLSLMSKHTIGAGALVAIASHALLADRLHPARLGLRAGGRLARAGALGAVGMGAASPVALILLWLAAKGALGAFLMQVLVEAPAAKGPVLGTVTRFVTVVFMPGLFETASALGLGALVVLGLVHGARRWVRPELRRPLLVLLVTSTMVAGALTVGVVTPQGLPRPRVPQLAAASLSLWGCLVLAVIHTVRLGRNRHDAESWQRSLFAVTSFLLLYALSLSWGLYEQMVVPGLACVLGEVGGTATDRDDEPFAQWCVVGLSLCLISIGAACKQMLPYDWSLWREPPLWDKRAASQLPELGGMNLSAATAQVVDRLTHDIDDASDADEPILVYPYLTLFYELAHRPPVTFARVHWYDVTPDLIARADAQRILDHPPRVIVRVETSREYDRANEEIFRGGALSGQRSIEEAIETLAPLYQVIDRVTMPYSKVSIVVLRRTQ
jgi:hypothetical protein